MAAVDCAASKGILVRPMVGVFCMNSLYRRTLIFAGVRHSNRLIIIRDYDLPVHVWFNSWELVIAGTFVNYIPPNVFVFFVWVYELAHSSLHVSSARLKKTYSVYILFQDTFFCINTDVHLTLNCAPNPLR